MRQFALPPNTDTLKHFLNLKHSYEIATPNPFIRFEIKMDFEMFTWVAVCVHVCGRTGVRLKAKMTS